MSNEEESELKGLIKDQKKALRAQTKRIKELKDENILLWNYLEELRDQEKQLMSQIGVVLDDYIIKNMKPVGDA